MTRTEDIYQGQITSPFESFIYGREQASLYVLICFKDFMIVMYQGQIISQSFIYGRDQGQIKSPFESLIYGRDQASLYMLICFKGLMIFSDLLNYSIIFPDTLDAVYTSHTRSVRSRHMRAIIIKQICSDDLHLNTPLRMLNLQPKHVSLMLMNV